MSNLKQLHTVMQVAKNHEQQEMQKLAKLMQAYDHKKNHIQELGRMSHHYRDDAQHQARQSIPCERFKHYQHFTSAHGTVRDLIEDALPKLGEMFEENGLSLNDVNVSDQQGQEQAFRDENFNQGNAFYHDSEFSQESATVIHKKKGLVDYYA